MRPTPARTGPRRSPDGLLRGESGSSVPGADAVSSAYQVLDRYLEEGRQHAAGRSAWYPGQPGDGAWSQPGRWQNALSPNNWLAEVARLLMQLSQLGGGLPSWSRLLAGLANPAGAGVVPPPFHPAQRPEYPDWGTGHAGGGGASTPDPSKEPISLPDGFASGGVLGDFFSAPSSQEWQPVSAAEVEQDAATTTMARTASDTEASQDDESEARTTTDDGVSGSPTNFADDISRVRPLERGSAVGGNAVDDSPVTEPTPLIPGWIADYLAENRQGPTVPDIRTGPDTLPEDTAPGQPGITPEGLASTARAVEDRGSQPRQTGVRIQDGQTLNPNQVVAADRLNDLAATLRGVGGPTFVRP